MKIQNQTLQEFINKFIVKLENENYYKKEYEKKKELNIPFILSSLCQNFSENPNKYKEFISDLAKYTYDIEVIDAANEYNGIIDVNINLFESNTKNPYDGPNYKYEISFSENERYWGYCECTPDMKDYREDKHCCGHGCDATFCSFSFRKVIYIVEDSWHGDEHDYWDFEDEFYLNHKELADEKEKTEKEKRIQELKSRIEEESKLLEELMSQ